MKICGQEPQKPIHFMAVAGNECTVACKQMEAPLTKVLLWFPSIALTVIDTTQADAQRNGTLPVARAWSYSLTGHSCGGMFSSISQFLLNIPLPSITDLHIQNVDTFLHLSPVVTDTISHWFIILHQYSGKFYLFFFQFNS